MSPEHEVAAIEVDRPSMERYRCLGLIANPFAPAREDDEPGVACEIAAEGNALLAALAHKRADDAPLPLVVRKADLPSQYMNRAIAHAEFSLANDEDLNILYGYVQLFMMRVGPIRATLGVVGERLMWRDFERTLVAYVGSVLEHPDEELVSYSALGPDGLSTFSSEYSDDPAGAVRRVFGAEVGERHPELASAGDMRAAGFEGDGDETDSSPEMDETIGDAPGNRVLLAEAAQTMADEDKAVLDYVIEYAKVHLSSVVARALRIYRERGLAAAADELRVTKAPRKTLAKVIELASVRFDKVCLMFDGFEAWLDVDPDVRSRLVGSLSDLRWKTAGNAIPVFFIAEGDAPEIEETFSSATVVEWAFRGLEPMQSQPGVLLADVVERWLSCAASSDDTKMSLEDPVLGRLSEEAGESMSCFVRMADAAIESAAERGISALDDTALEAGLQAAEQVD